MRDERSSDGPPSAHPSDGWPWLSRSVQREVDAVTKILYFLVREMVHDLEDGPLVAGWLPPRLLLAHPSRKRVKNVGIRAQVFNDVVNSLRSSLVLCCRNRLPFGRRPTHIVH